VARKVSVGLEADVAGFLGPVLESAAATEKLDNKVDELDRSIGKLAPDALKAGAGLTAMGDSADRASTKTEKLRDSSGRFVAAGTEMAETAHRAKESVDDLKDKVDGLDHALDKIPADALKAGAAMKLLSGDIKDVGTNFQAVGDKSTAMTVLDQRIRNTRGEVKKLTEEFVKTGDVDVFQRLGKASGNLSALTKIRKDLVNGLESAGDEGGRGFVRRFVDSLGSGSNSLMQGLSNIPFAGILFKPIASAIESMPPEAQAAIGAAVVGAIVAASAAIGAALNGALLAGIGLGGLGLGIAGQIGNPAVKAAFSSLGKSLGTELTYASSSFAVPLVNTAHIFQSAMSVALQKLRLDLDGLAPHLEPLARAIAALFTHIGPGLSEAFKAAGPILDRFAKELPGLGDSLSRFFALMADGSKGAGDGLSLLFLTIETLIVGIGGLIDGLSHLYHWFLAPGRAILGWYDELTGKTAGVAHSLGSVAGGTDDLGNAAASAAPSLEELNSLLGKTAVTADTLAAKMTQKLFDSMMSIDQANLSVAESLTRVDEALKSNGRQLDIHNKKGQANREAILSAVTANMQLYQAQISAGVSAKDAAAAYDQNTAALERQLRKAGLTQKQIDGLIGKYKAVPDKVNTAIAINGLTDAINGLADLIRMLNGIPKLKTTIVRTVFTSSGNLASGQSRLGGGNQGQYGAIRMAEGGALVGPSNPGTFLFGEPQTGGEAFIPLRGIPQSRAMGLAQVVGDHYGFGVSPWNSGPRGFTVNFTFGGNLDSGLATWFMRAVRRGDIQMSAS
jgi:ribosome-associated translation inhibitor RaiA